MITIDLVSIWFSVGSFIALLLCLAGKSTIVQIISFSIISLLCIIVTRALAKKYLQTEIVNTNADRIIGKHGLVTRAMDANTKGEIKVLSTFWTAIAHDNGALMEGGYCEILTITRVTTVVKKTEK